MAAWRGEAKCMRTRGLNSVNGEFERLEDKATQKTWAANEHE